MAGLTSEQITFYKDEGYLVLDHLVSPAAYQRLVDELNWVVDQKAQEARRAGRLADAFEHAPFDTRLALVCNALGEGKSLIGEALGKRHKSAGLFHFLTHPEILDVVESMIGPEILFHPQFNLRAKMPGEDEVDWHQDIAFLDREVEQTFMVNFFIPLVDTTIENGCLEVLAGSHKAGILPHLKGQGEKAIAEEDLPVGGRVICEVSAGGAVMVQHKTAHRSFANQTDQVRWSLDIRYSDSRLPTGRAHVPSFVARSQAHPDQVAQSHVDWLALMAEKPLI